MPPIRRKKKGEDDSSDTSAAQPARPSSRTANAAAASKPASTASTTRSNPLGNKTARPLNNRNSPERSTSKASSKAPLSRQNSTKQPSSKQPPKSITVAPAPLRDSTPVSPVSPVAHENNQLSIREITPPSGQPQTQLIRHEARSPVRSPTTRQGQIVPRTPTTGMKRRSARKISQFEKDRLIENIRYEVERRAKALRQRYTLQAEMLRQGIELRVGRIPYKMRNVTMGELYDQAAATAEFTNEKEKRIEAGHVVKQLEDVRRLSNHGDEAVQLKVAKKRTMSPAKPLEHPPPTSTLKSPIALLPPPTITTIKLVPRTSPVQTFHAVQSSPVKAPTFTQKAMTGLKNRLAHKKTVPAPSAPTMGLRAVASVTTAAKAPAVSASVAVTKAAKAPKAVRGKAAAASTTTPAVPAPKKAAGRALRSRK
ncbi:hypothetical protein ABW20_dc0108601 [Dactylellina cionopaga]|nr:hypothetical protein ABW20_dc0108601 [Dactylellina cionopaga]